MNKSIIFILLPIVLFSFFSCSPKYYAPNAQNITMFEEKGEVQASFGMSNYFDHWRIVNGFGSEFQFAYAPTNNLGLQLNNSFYSNEFDLTKTNSNFHELGIGYYKPIDDKYIFEIYGLAGLGSTKSQTRFSRESTRSGDLSAKFSRFAIQPSIGVKNKRGGFAFSTRIGLLNYHDIEGDLELYGNDQREYLNQNSKSILIEPTLKGWIDYKSLRLFGQIGASNNKTNPSFQQEKYNFTFGATFVFPSGKKKKTDKGF